jgi:hypothetical protein
MEDAHVGQVGKLLSCAAPADFAPPPRSYLSGPAQHIPAPILSQIVCVLKVRPNGLLLAPTIHRQTFAHAMHPSIDLSSTAGMIGSSGHKVLGYPLSRPLPRQGRLPPALGSLRSWFVSLRCSVPSGLLVTLWEASYPIPSPRLTSL